MKIIGQVTQCRKQPIIGQFGILHLQLLMYRRNRMATNPPKHWIMDIVDLGKNVSNFMCRWCM